MDPRVAGAGIAMALGMMLLLPTFNALNNSYVENVQPPPWMPTPDEIPEDFQPPEDWEPPPDWEPPEDYEIPPGWEPPPGYDGPIPPGGCPPPVIRRLDDMEHSGTIGPQWPGAEYPFTIPKYTAGLSANVTFTNWRASEVRGALEDPNGNTSKDRDAGNAGSLLVPAQPKGSSKLVMQFIVNPEDGSNMPAQGEYLLSLSASLPVSGDYQTQVEVAILCGGLLE